MEIMDKMMIIMGKLMTSMGIRVIIMAKKEDMKV